MKIKLIYPKWPKLERQTEFHLPPHGPICFAATVPDDVELTFIDEHVEAIDFDERVDLVAISCMLTCQIPRGWEIADIYRKKGIPVIFGGIGTMLHAEETKQHADAVFLGEAEGRFGQVLDDLKNGNLKKVYDYQWNFPDMKVVGPGAAEYPEARPVQLSRRTDGRPYPCLAGLPVQLLSAAARRSWAAGNSGRGRSTMWSARWPRSRTTACSSWTTPWRRTTSGKRTCSGR